MSVNDNSSDFISFGSSVEDDSSLEYEYDDEEEEASILDEDNDDQDDVIAETTPAPNQVEIIFPPEQQENGGHFSETRIPCPDLTRQQSEVSSMALSFVSVSNGNLEAPLSRENAQASVNHQANNAESSSTTSSWSHVDSVSAVQSLSTTPTMSTMMYTYADESSNDATSVASTTARSIISAFEQIHMADGSIHARCKACDYMNPEQGGVLNKVGLCRGCGAVLSNNPCLDMDEQIARSLQQYEEKQAVKELLQQEKLHRKLASKETPPFVRAQALAAEIVRFVSTQAKSLQKPHQEECPLYHPMKEMDLTFLASNFIDCFDRLRGGGYRLDLGYTFTLKTEINNVCRDGLPENGSWLCFSTDPEVALRIKNGLTALPVPIKKMKDDMKKKKEKETTKDDNDKKHQEAEETSTDDKNRLTKPKCPRSPYSFYFDNMRPKILEESGNEAHFVAMAKDIGKLWHILSDEERQMYFDMSQRDVARYRQEMQAYENDPKQQQQQTSSSESCDKAKQQEAVVTEETKVKGKISARKPTCERNAYGFFFDVMGPKIILEKYPQKGWHRNMAKAAGERWKALSNEERQVYRKLAQPDAVRSRTEMQSYGWYYNMAKLVQERWKALSDEERQVYQELAQRDAVRYSNEMKAFVAEQKRQERSKIGNDHDSTNMGEDPKQDKKNNNDEQDQSSSELRDLMYNESVCVGWIAAVITRLDEYAWETVYEYKFLQKTRTIEFMSARTSQTLQCLPMAYFDATHRKDPHVASLLQGLAEICVDCFQSDSSLNTIDEEHENEPPGEKFDQDESCKDDNEDQSSASIDLINNAIMSSLRMPLKDLAPVGCWSSDDEDDVDTRVVDDEDLNSSILPEDSKPAAK